MDLKVATKSIDRIIDNIITTLPDQTSGSLPTNKIKMSRVIGMELAKGLFVSYEKRAERKLAKEYSSPMSSNAFLALVQEQIYKCCDVLEGLAVKYEKTSPEIEKITGSYEIIKGWIQKHSLAPISERVMVYMITIITGVHHKPLIALTRSEYRKHISNMISLIQTIGRSSKSKRENLQEQ